MARRKSLDVLLISLRQQRPLLVKEYGVRTLEVFGSYVRTEQEPDSDLDLLVTFSQPPSLFNFVHLENYLSDTLGVRVDLVMKESLKPGIGNAILGEAILV